MLRTEKMMAVVLSGCLLFGAASAAVWADRNLVIDKHRVRTLSELLYEAGEQIQEEEILQGTIRIEICSDMHETPLLIQNEQTFRIERKTGASYREDRIAAEMDGIRYQEELQSYYDGNKQGGKLLYRLNDRWETEVYTTSGSLSETLFSIFSGKRAHAWHITKHSGADRSGWSVEGMLTVDEAMELFYCADEPSFYRESWLLGYGKEEADEIRELWQELRIPAKLEIDKATGKPVCLLVEPGKVFCDTKSSARWELTFSYEAEEGLKLPPEFIQYLGE